MANTVSKNATKERLIDVALKIAESKGWAAMTRDSIARSAGCSTGIVSVRFGAMDDMRAAVMRAAVKREVLKVIAQGLAMGDKHAKAAPKELRARAAATL